MKKITIPIKKKKKKRVRKKSNKFKTNKEANIFLPKIIEHDERKKEQLRRVKRMSARKQNMGLQDDYVGTDEM